MMCAGITLASPEEARQVLFEGVNGDRDEERNIIHRSPQIGKEQNRLAVTVSLIPTKFWNALA